MSAPEDHHPTVSAPVYNAPPHGYGTALPPPAYHVPPPGYGVPQPPPQQALGQTPPPQQAQPMMYVFAPLGSYEVTGAPGLFAVPQGQSMSYPPSAPSYIPQFANYTSGGSSTPRNLAIASLVLYIVGFFTVVCTLPSVILSLHMVRKGYIRENRAAVIAFCVMELVGWAFVPAFSWFGYCDDYDYYYGYCDSYAYFGWIAFLVFWVFELAFGIPRIIYTWKYDNEVETYSPIANTPNSDCSTTPRNLAIAALILYIVGFFTVVCTLPSVILSLYMCGKGYIREKKAAVIAFCVLELVAWVFVPAFSWFGYCDDYDYYGYCDSFVYFGWIAFLVFGVFELAFGIPRIIYTWKYDNEVVSYPPLVSANMPDSDNCTKGSSSVPKNLALVSLILYIVGFFTFVCALPSIILSLHMVRKGYIRERRAAVIAFCVLELIGWAFVPAFSWYGQCEYYYDYWGYRYCAYFWLGWISFVVFAFLELAFGIPRIIFTWRYDNWLDAKTEAKPMNQSHFSASDGYQTF